MAIFIRWLGAFNGREFKLKNMLKHELSMFSGEAACEKIIGKDGNKKTSIICSTSIGLLVNPEVCFRDFGYDCYSKLNNKKLLESRSRHSAPRKNDRRHHNETWFRYGKSSYIGIVAQKTWYELPWETRQTVLNASAKYSLPIFELTNGKLKGKVKEK